MDIMPIEIPGPGGQYSLVELQNPVMASNWKTNRLYSFVFLIIIFHVVMFELMENINTQHAQSFIILQKFVFRSFVFDFLIVLHWKQITDAQLTSIHYLRHRKTYFDGKSCGEYDCTLYDVRVRIPQRLLFFIFSHSLIYFHTVRVSQQDVMLHWHRVYWKSFDL